MPVRSGDGGVIVVGNGGSNTDLEGESDGLKLGTFAEPRRQAADGTEADSYRAKVPTIGESSVWEKNAYS